MSLQDWNKQPILAVRFVSSATQSAGTALVAAADTPISHDGRSSARANSLHKGYAHLKASHVSTLVHRVFRTGRSRDDKWQSR
eukprot:1752375-Amphidinium_carterae.1